MAISVKIDSFERERILQELGLTPAEQAASFAAFARDELAEAEADNRAALGRETPHTTFVDGREGTDADIDRVKPDSTVVFEFNLLEDLFAWIGEQLVLHSPVGGGKDPHPGLYAASHRFFADGEEVPAGAPAPEASEYVFVSTLPYGRKIERGESAQAPDGVYEAVASMAAARFGNLARIRLTYRSPITGNQSDIARVGPLLVKRDAKGRHVTGSGVRKGNHEERAQRQPAIVITLRG